MLTPTGFQKGGDPYVIHNTTSSQLHKGQALAEPLFYKVSLINCYEMCTWLGSGTEGEMCFLTYYHMITLCGSHVVGLLWESQCTSPKGSKG